MMDDKPQEELLSLELVKEKFERDPSVQDYLATTLWDHPGREAELLEELTKDPAEVIRAIERVSGKTAKDLANQPGGIPHYLQELENCVGGISRLWNALVGGRGLRHAVKALQKVKRDEVRQVKFECSEEFYERLMDEKLQRNLTIQQLAVRALERYLALPESVHRSIEEEAERTSTPLPGFLRRLMQRLSTLIHEPEMAEKRPTAAGAVQLRNALEAVQHYLEQLPLEKVQLLRESLALDLKYYRSSRRKRPTPRKGTPDAGSAESEGDD
jgi:hypothetical protein